MDKIKRYSRYIQQLLSQYAERGSSDNEVETEFIFDTERDRYQVVYTGWKNQLSMYGCVLHL